MKKYYVNIDNVYTSLGHSGTELDPFSLEQFLLYTTSGETFYFKGHRILSSNLIKNEPFTIKPWNFSPGGPWRIYGGTGHKFQAILSNLNYGIIEASSVSFNKAFQLYVKTNDPTGISEITSGSTLKNITIISPKPPSFLNAGRTKLESCIIVVDNPIYIGSGSVLLSTSYSNRNSIGSTFTGLSGDKGGNVFSWVPPPFYPLWNDADTSLFKLGTDEGSTFIFPTTDIYSVPAIKCIEYSENELVLATNQLQLIDEYLESKDSRPLSSSRLINNDSQEKVMGFIPSGMFSDIYIDITGKDRSDEAYWDCGANDIDGKHVFEYIDRYVDVFPAQNIPGNDGSTNLLWHLDQAPIIDKSSNGFTPRPNGIQIRNGYGILKGTWSISSPCLIDLTEGFTVDFRIKFGLFTDWSNDLGYLGIPIAISSQSSTVSAQLGDVTVTIGDVEIPHHIAIEIIGNRLLFFVDGIKIYDGPVLIDYFEGTRIILGAFSGEHPGDGELQIQEFRLSNGIRWYDDFYPYWGGTHYSDWGKLGFYFNPMSQSFMEGQLFQHIAKVPFIYHVWGDATFWSERRFAYSNRYWTIEGEILIEGFQNDGRGIATLDFDSRGIDLNIDPNSKLSFDKDLFMWNLKDALPESILFHVPKNIEILKPVTPSHLAAGNCSIVGTGLRLGQYKFDNIVCREGFYVATYRNRIYTSPDAENWTLVYTATQIIMDLANADNIGYHSYAAVGEFGLFLMSSEGSSWIVKSSSVTSHIISVKHKQSHGNYVACTTGGEVLYVSANTILDPVLKVEHTTPWELRAILPHHSGDPVYPERVRAFGYNNITWQLTASNYRYAVGTGVLTFWDEGPLSEDVVPMDALAVYGDEGDEEIILCSDKGIGDELGNIWIPTSYEMREWRSSSSYYPGAKGVAVGYNGLIYICEDLNSSHVWTLYPSGTTEHLKGVVFDSTRSRFVAVGDCPPIFIPLL